MRDLHLRHTLQALARDAAGVFTDIVEAGQEIPYEVGEPGESFAFCQYRPLTAKFVRDNATELRELESFREAAETLRRTELAATYLEEAGIAPPADQVERATLAVTYFLARLWDGCSEFELEGERFGAAIEEVEACAEPDAGEVEAIVPLIGLQMPVARLDLHGASIVRAETVDVPAEAARGERPGRGQWEPSFLITARVTLDPDGGLGGAGERVASTFERVVTTLRLHRSGGVGLGPHGWVRVAGDRWRRITTGAARPRPGGYRLGEDELDELASLARTVAVHTQRLGRMRRALMRFEAGLDRRAAIDALSDHLLSLRFMLEGEGPAGMGLALRAAALGAGDDRTAARRAVDDAVALERELCGGEPSELDDRSPSEAAAAVEELLRGILRTAISGELGSDLRTAADETLLADGLAIGEGMTSELGSTTESDLDPIAAPDVSDVPEATEVGVTPSASEQSLDDDADPAPGSADEEAFERFERDPEPIIRASRREPLPAPAPRPDAGRERAVPAGSGAPEDADSGSEGETTTRPRRGELELWMPEDAEETMDFPVRENHIEELSQTPMDREEVKERVEYLFPRTETDWSVGDEGERRAAAS